MSKKVALQRALFCIMIKYKQQMAIHGTISFLLMLKVEAGETIKDIGLQTSNYHNNIIR